MYRFLQGWKGSCLNPKPLDAAAGEAIFDEEPTALSMLGAAMICGSTVIVAMVEQRQAAGRRAAAAANALPLTA